MDKGPLSGLSKDEVRKEILERSRGVEVQYVRMKRSKSVRWTKYR